MKVEIPELINQNKMNITIRKAVEADYPQIIELFKEFAAFEKYPEKMVNSIERMTDESEYFHCYVAEDNEGKIAGYVTCFFCYYTWTGKCLYMDDLYVKPEFRGNGLGKRLINAVVEYAKNTQCHKLRWQVSGWNKPAIEFYTNLGASIDNVQLNCDLNLDETNNIIVPAGG